MPRPITVTYTLHPTSGPQREHLLDALTGVQAQLPLRNLHWKPSTRTALRTIQEVNVRLTDLGELGPQREVGGSVMDGALVNLCLVACDVSQSNRALPSQVSWDVEMVFGPAGMVDSARHIVPVTCGQQDPTSSLDMCMVEL